LESVSQQKKNTVWSEAMTAGEPKTQRVPKKGTP